MIGQIKLPGIRGTHYTIAGGPFRKCPQGDKNLLRIRLAPELKECSFDLAVPIKDFSVPDRLQLIAVMEQTLRAMMEGRSVYVGCMGGQGRTGIFLSAFAKLWGVKDPIGWV